MNHPALRHWRWWTAEPRRIVAGFIIALIAIIVLYVFIVHILIPLIEYGFMLLILLGIIRYALKGHVGSRPHGK